LVRKLVISPIRALVFGPSAWSAKIPSKGVSTYSSIRVAIARWR